MTHYVEWSERLCTFVATCQAFAGVIEQRAQRRRRSAQNVCRFLEIETHATASRRVASTPSIDRCDRFALYSLPRATIPRNDRTPRDSLGTDVHPFLHARN